MISALRANPRNADLGPARRAMLDYVIVLTETPWLVTRDHIEAMRAQGFSDQAISVVNLVTCFFAWCNRAVDGVGVPLESWWRKE